MTAAASLRNLDATGGLDRLTGSDAVVTTRSRANLNLTAQSERSAMRATALH